MFTKMVYSNRSLFNFVTGTIKNQNYPLNERIRTQKGVSSTKIFFQNNKQHPNRCQLHTSCNKIFKMLFMQGASHKKSLFCKIDLIRKSYNMKKTDHQMSLVDQQMRDMIPDSLARLKKAFPYLPYPNKNMYTALALVMGTEEDLNSDLLTTFLSSLESVMLGYQIHKKTQGKHFERVGNNLGNWMTKHVYRRIKDSYYVLGGDFFHIKGSFLASSTGSISISKIISQLEISLSELIYLQNALENKIKQKRYGQVTIEQIHQINLKKIAPIIAGLKGLHHITRNDINSQINENDTVIYETVGLLFCYRLEIEEFMFNFPTIIRKFQQYTSSTIKFDREDKISHYLFHQGVKDSNRIDIAYLNTIQALSNEIQFLEKQLQMYLGHHEYEQLMTRLNYAIIVYS